MSTDRDWGGRAAQPRRRSAAVDAARSVAFEVLCAVDVDDAYANLLLPELLRKRNADPRDAAFATEMTYSTLRFCGQIDAIIDEVSSRPVEQMDPSSRNAIRLGACQLLHLRTPEHAAISTSVDLVAKSRQSAAGFVNAVLRKVQARDLASWLEHLGAGKPAGERLALEFSHPRWIVNAFVDALGRAGRSDDNEIRDLLAADNAPARPMLVARPGVCDVEELEVSTSQTRGRWSEFAVSSPAGEPGALPAVREGRAAVQDEGSQLVALLAAHAPVIGSDAQWLDGCAGPGGKAALLAALGQSRGAHVTAIDQSAHRVELVARACRPFSNVTLHTADASRLSDYPWLPPGGYDRILVDVPCTGIGALRRRPELRWRRQASDVGGLAGIQEAILLSALQAARRGACVTYSTCSPHLLETDSIVERARNRALALGIATEVIDARSVISAGGVTTQPEALIQTQHDEYLRLWPHAHGTDAMFAAVIRVSP